MKKLKSRYSPLTTALLLCSILLSGCSAIRSSLSFFTMLGQYIDTSYQPYSDTNGLLPYLDTMSGYYGRPDMTTIIEQLVFGLGMGILAAGLIIVLKRGTDNRTLPTIFCMGALALAAVRFLGSFLQLLFVSEYVFLMLMQGVIAAVLIALMAFFPRITTKRKIVTYLSVAVIAVLLFIPTVMPDYVFSSDMTIGTIITMLGIMGIAEAVKEDGNEAEEIETEEGEEEDGEEYDV